MPLQRPLREAVDDLDIFKAITGNDGGAVAFFQVKMATGECCDPIDAIDEVQVGEALVAANEGDLVRVPQRAPSVGR